MLCENKIFVCDEYSCDGPYDQETKTFNGFCKIKYTNRDSYEGFIKKDKFNGNGIYKTREYVYSGQWKDSMKHGSGIMTYTCGDIYEGEFENNLKHGTGKFTSNKTCKLTLTSVFSVFQVEYSNEIYHGEWKHDKKNGNGTLTKILKFINISAYYCVYSGVWNDDILHECVIKQYDAENKTKLISTYIGKIDKYGLSDDKNGKTIHEKFYIQGGYKNGSVYGFSSTIFIDDTTLIKTEYDNISKTGVVYYKNGTIFEGNFEIMKNYKNEINKINGITKYNIDGVEYSYTSINNNTMDGKMINIEYIHHQQSICSNFHRVLTFTNSEWKNGKIINGTCKYDDGSIYDGDFLMYEDKILKHGNGTFTSSSTKATYYGIYEYEIIKLGTAIYKNGDVYCGEFYFENVVTQITSSEKKNNLKNYNHCRHGQGKMKYSNGTVYEGQWCKNHPVGISTITKNGEKYYDFSLFGINIFSNLYNLEDKLHDIVFGKHDEFGTNEPDTKKSI